MDDLPEELLCRVFQSLPRRDLRKLSLVDRRFQRIIAPLLYSDCELVREHHEPQLRAIRNFLRTLVKSPDLRPLVQNIRVGPWLTDSPDATDAGVAHVSVKLSQKISASVSAITNYPTEIQSDFDKQLKESSQDAMIFAILNNTPNLKSLTLDTEGIGYDDWEEAMAPCDVKLNDRLTMKLFELSASPSLGGSHIFKTLSYLCIAGRLSLRDSDPKWLELEGWDSSLLPLFLKLPTLRTFVGSGCRDWRRQGDIWPIEKRSSAVINVILTDCELKTPIIQQLLRSCKSLERLECLRKCDDCYGDVDDPYEGLHEDLYRHRDSLHTLHLHKKACGCKNAFNYDPIKSFAGLDNLQELCIDEIALFGNIEAEERALTDILPCSLKRLVIMGESIQDDVFQAIERALKSDKDFPAVEVREGCPLKALEFVRRRFGLRVRKVNDEALNKWTGSFIIDRR